MGSGLGHTPRKKDYENNLEKFGNQLACSPSKM